MNPRIQDLYKGNSEYLFIESHPYFFGGPFLVPHLEPRNVCFTDRIRTQVRAKAQLIMFLDFLGELRQKLVGDYSFRGSPFGNNS